MTISETVKTLPRLKENPLLGSLGGFQKDRVGLFMRVAEECGDIGLFHIGPLRLIQVNSPQLIEQFLGEHAQDLEKGMLIRDVFGTFLGQSLFTSDGELHDKQRTLIEPKFEPGHFDSFVEAMIKLTTQQIESWQEGQTVVLMDEVGASGRRIISQILFGEASTLDDSTLIGQNFKITREWTDYALLHTLNPPPSVPTPRNRRYKKAVAELRQGLQNIVEEHRQHPEKSDMLSILLGLRYNDGSPMSDQQLLDELCVIIGAHEIVAVVLTWAFYRLSQTPFVYDQLQAELDQVLQGQPPSLHDLQRLPYNNLVVKEILRLNPPTPGLIRAAKHDFNLGGYAVKKGDILYALAYAVGRNPSLYPDPLKFSPGRFNDNLESRLSRYSYFPFGIGNRNCLGKNLAKLELPLVIATLAQKVRFELAESQPVFAEAGFNIQPRGGLKVRVKRRVKDEG